MPSRPIHTQPTSRQTVRLRMRRREGVAMDWFPLSLRVASVPTSVESGERTTRLIRSNPGRSLYDEDTTESQGFYHDGAKTRKIAKILVAFELLGGLDAFHREIGRASCRERMWMSGEGEVLKETQCARLDASVSSR